MKEITVFSKEWFKLHQETLLKFANTRAGRYVLRIHGDRSSVGEREIIEIGPNYIKWDGAYEFRTHAKFSKRLYHAFKPVWHMAHLWDIGIANNLKPTLNLGFDTLTVFPDGDPESSTVDGTVWRDVDPGSDTLSNLRSGAGTTAVPSDDQLDIGLGANNVSNQFRILYRSFTLFDTSAINDAFVIDSATISLYSFSPAFTDFGDVNAHVVSSTPASNTNLTTSDYGSVGSTSFGSKAESTWPTGGYGDVALNASGLAAISKTGITKFAWITEWDLNNSFTGVWTSFGFTDLIVASAENTGTANDPKLVVNSSATTTSTSSTSASTSTSQSTSTSSTSRSTSTSSTSRSTSTSSTSSSTSKSTSTSSTSQSTSISTSISTSLSSTSSSTSTSVSFTTSTSSTSSSISTSTSKSTSTSSTSSSTSISTSSTSTSRSTSTSSTSRSTSSSTSISSTSQSTSQSTSTSSTSISVSTSSTSQSTSTSTTALDLSFTSITIRPRVVRIHQIRFTGVRTIIRRRR